VLNRYTMAADLAGSFKPGQPLTLHIQVTAALASPTTTVDVLLPEMALVGPDNSPIGIAAHGNRLMKNAAQWTVPVARDNMIAQQTGLTFPKAGYYRVSVKVDAGAAPTVAENGQMVQNVAVKEFWVWISDVGGRVTSVFEPALFPDSIIVAPGPFRTVSSLLTSSAALAPSAGLTSKCISGDAVYSNRDTNTTVGIPDAYLDYAIQDNVYGNEYGAVRTDGNGHYSICWEGSTNSYGDVALYFRGTYMFDSDTLTNFGRGVGTGTQNILVWDNARGQAFTKLYRTAVASLSVFGHTATRSEILIDTLSSATSDSYYWAIRLQGNSAIWGEFGRFTMSHEYGHLYDFTNLTLTLTDGGCNNQPHFPFNEYTLGCAYSEGWADYFAVATRPSEFPSYVYNIENGNGSTTADGSRVENDVAGFYLDLTDATPTEVGDSLALGGAYVSNVLASCEVYTSGTWAEASGVDHATYCFENQVDSAVTGNSIYFPTRSVDPTNQRNTATRPTGWTSSKVRAIWKKTLYYGR
jgi:hypothetical protein